MVAVSYGSVAVLNTCVDAGAQAEWVSPMSPSEWGSMSHEPRRGAP